MIQLYAVLKLNKNYCDNVGNSKTDSKTKMVTREK